MQPIDRSLVVRPLDAHRVLVLYAATGEPVHALDAAVFPVGSDRLARHPHPEGLVLSTRDARALGLRFEDESADPLTIAYIACGARLALRGGALSAAVSDRFGGELGFIGACIAHAPLLDALGARAGDALTGVFAYEVAETFGLEYAGTLIAGEPDLPERARRMAQAHVAAACAHPPAGSPTCGHSACSQHYIDTGSSACVAADDVITDLRAACRVLDETAPAFNGAGLVRAAIDRALDHLEDAA